MLWELCCPGDIFYYVDVIDNPSIQQVLSVPDQTWPESGYYLSFVQLMVKHNKVLYVSFSGCLAATLYLTAMLLLQQQPQMLIVVGVIWFGWQQLAEQVLPSANVKWQYTIVIKSSR